VHPKDHASPAKAGVQYRGAVWRRETVDHFWHRTWAPAFAGEA